MGNFMFQISLQLLLCFLLLPPVAKDRSPHYVWHELATVAIVHSMSCAANVSVLLSVQVLSYQAWMR